MAAEVFTLQQLRYDVRAAIRAGVDVVHADHVRMREHAGRFGFALETRDDIWLAREFVMQELDGEALGVEARVPGFVDAPHAAFTDHAQHFVGTVEQLADDRILVVRCVFQRSRVARAHAKVRRVACTASRTNPRVDRREANLRTARSGDDFQSPAMLALRLRAGYGQAREPT